MNYLTWKTKLLFAGALLLVVLVFTSLFFLRQAPPTPTFPQIPTPTPLIYTRNPSGNFRFTPLQKTEIGVTTDKEVEERTSVLTKSTKENVTIYKIQSDTSFETDEIRTQNGVVIFESINIFNKKAGFPPKLSTYQGEFGQPEKVLDGVSPLGRHISAYIYAQQGFTLFVNRATKTVYEIQRFTPMSTADYEKQYAEYLQPAPTYPVESPN